MPQTTLTINGKDNASAAIKGLTGSIVSANVVFGALTKVVDFAANAGKAMVAEYRKSEEALSDLKTVVGNTAPYEAFAASIQKITKVEDDTVIGMQRLGINMGISKDQINNATKGAIGLSTAFSIDLTTAMKMTAQANQGQYTMLSRYIPELRNATTESERQAIVQQKMREGFEIAEARAQTFSGRLEQLKNVHGNLNETVGGFVAGAGKGFVEAMISGEEGMIDFLKSAEGIDKISDIAGGIAGSISVMIEAVKPIGDVMKTAFSTVGDSFNSFSKLESGTKGAGIGISVLKGVVVGAGTAIAVMSGTVSGLITLLANIINVVKQAGSVIAAAFSGNWAKAAEEVKKLGTAVIDTGTDVKKSVETMVTGAIKTFEKLNTEVDTKKLSELYGKTMSDIKNNIVETMGAAGTEGGAALNTNTETALQNTKKTMDDFQKDALSAAVSTWGGMQNVTNMYYENELTAAEGNDAKIKQLKKEQFTANKTVAAITTVINTAQAIMKALAELGPFGIPMAAVIGTMGAIQTGLIMSQPEPSFASGGSMGYTGFARVGERGPEDVLLPAGAMVRSAQESGGMGGININGPVNVYANNAMEFRDSLLNLQRLERARA